MITRSLAVATVLVLAAPGAAAAAPGGAATTVRISTTIAGGEPDNFSNEPAVSADGRSVAFTSAGSDLVARDTNRAWDVFVRDVRTGRTERVSLSAAGRQLNGASHRPAISADGRYVAFLSFATDVVPGDPNPAGNIYLRDRRAGTTVRIPPPSAGAAFAPYADDPAISADGRTITFSSANPVLPGDTNELPDVYAWSRDTGRVELVSVSPQGAPGTGESYDASLSADGRWVAFASTAGNLTGGADPGGWQVYLRDLAGRTTTVVSTSAAGTPGDDESNPAGVSADGRYVLFMSSATNLVPDDTNGVPDVFLRDRSSGSVRRVSLSRTGAQLAGGSGAGALSADGRRAAFVSADPSIVPGDTNQVFDVFARDLRTGAVTRASVPAGGGESDGDSYAPVLDATGTAIVFVSTAANLVPGPARGVESVYLRGRAAG